MISGSIWGKILGAVAGFLIYGPVGAMFGAFAGHVLDRMNDTGWFDRLLPPLPDRRQISFTVCLVSLAAKMARVDGPVNRAETAAFERIFHVPPHELRNVDRLFRRATASLAGFEPYAETLAETFADSPGLLEEVVEGLVIIAAADGPPNAAELRFLRAVAERFGIGETRLRLIMARHRGQEHADPYAVLGVAADAADDEVKAAYRRLSRETHPDALIARGLPADMIAVANDKMAAINGAWERIKKERGLA